eukprot:scaffold87653_cov53-Phaeocystis_antarctica.AAC.3
MAGESTTSTISKAVEARFYPVPRACRQGCAHEARADVAWHRASIECLGPPAPRETADTQGAGRCAVWS